MTLHSSQDVISSLELVEDVLGVAEHLRFDEYAFPLYLFEHGQQVLLHLLLSGRLKLLLDLLAVLQPLQLFVAPIDNFLLHKSLHSLLDCMLQRREVNLLRCEELVQRLLLLEPIRNHVSVAIPLVHPLVELASVALSALGHLLEDGGSEGLPLLDHLGRVRHLCFVRRSLLLSLGLVLGPHLRLLVVCALVTVLVLLGAVDYDQTITLEVVEEGDYSGVDVAGRLREDPPLVLLLVVGLFGLSCSLCSLLRIILGWSLAFGSLRVRCRLLEILLADALTLLLQQLLLLLGGLFTGLDLLEQKVALPATGSPFSATWVSCLPAGLQSFLAVLLVGVLDQGECLRVEHLDRPSEALCLFIHRRALWPEMQLEYSLHHVVVLHFSVGIVAGSWAVRQSRIAPEHEVGEGNLV